MNKEKALRLLTQRVTIEYTCKGEKEIVQDIVNNDNINFFDHIIRNNDIIVLSIGGIK